MKHTHRALYVLMMLAMPASWHTADAHHAQADSAGFIHSDRKISATTRIIRAWKKLELGAPVYTIDDLAATPGWLREADIQKVPFQTGVWNIWMKPGYTVYRIYPYISSQPTQDSPEAYECLVLKVKGDLSVEDLRHAIHERRRAVVVDSFSLSGVGVEIFKHSR